MIKHHLTVIYVSEGQRVPEGLQPARALVDEALQLMKRHREHGDEEFMAVAFGDGINHAHL